MANSQKCRVFVGNIPYYATQEQIVETCEEIGPVVSFRLVFDKETERPKGYGFCEYKDEETALSAIRNLNNRELHGRKLRVGFADNGKVADRNREEVHGGPAVAQGGPGLQQHVGLQAAMAAAVATGGATGGDSLSLQLAGMPKGQLTRILAELKVMASQDLEKTRRLLLSCPQLSKAVVQAHIMLNLVPPQMLQMPNMLQVPGPYAQTHHLGLPSVSQNNIHTGLMAQSPFLMSSLMSC